MQEPLGVDFTKISTRSSYKDLCKIMQGPQDVSRIFARSFHNDLYKITQGPPTGSHQRPHRIFSQGRLQDLGQDNHISRTPKTKPWNSCKIVRERPCPNSKDLFARISNKQLKWALRHNESDPTRTKCREGCTSHVKIAIRHAQSHEVARAHVNFHKTLRDKKWTLKKSKTTFYLGLSHFLSRSAK